MVLHSTDQECLRRTQVAARVCCRQLGECHTCPMNATRYRAWGSGMLPSEHWRVLKSQMNTVCRESVVSRNTDNGHEARNP